jgi:threonyl-tRNA synthetase
MSKIKVTLPDGSSHSFEKGKTVLDVARFIAEGLANATVVGEVDGVLVDASFKLEKDAQVKIITNKDKEGLEVLRHSTAHVLAEAVLELFPEAKPTIGPVIEGGLYYDFDHPPFTPEDIEKIEKRMKEITERKETCERMELTKENALKLFKDNPYKVEIITEIPESEKVTAYKQGRFIDLCRGPHVQHTGKVKAFKITKLAGAYWRGDAKNKQLQRLYATSFFDKKDLKAYLKHLEEAEKRDHKNVGRQLDLFMTSDKVGKGLPIWLPKGETIKREIENLAVEMEEQAGYERVTTPHLAKKELYLQSGHLPYYEESMYPAMQLDDGVYYLKAMNCPHHHLIYNHTLRSYRDLPLKIAEYGTCYRNELSGALSGLLRVRMLSMNDAHIYCTKEQVEHEFEQVIKMIVKYYEIFGLENYHFRLSLWDAKHTEKYLDEPKNWEYCQDVLREVLKRSKVECVEADDEAAFYGPKVDIQYKTVTGREETMSTIQLDFAAKTKFGLTYTDKEGKENNEVYVIHRAPLSTHERFLAFVIEQCAGKFPLWMSPVQVAILPIADRHEKYAHKVRDALRAEKFRVEVDDRAESIPKKVRDNQLKQINYILVVGDKEMENETVNVRTRDNTVHGEKEIHLFIKELKQERKEKKK